MNIPRNRAIDDTTSPGVVKGSDTTDYLYRLSLKMLIRNSKGEILVVKERGRDWWDLPGGGMDYGETIRECLARELYEEVGYKAGFNYRIIAMEEPKHLQRLDILQVCVLFEIFPEEMDFGPGADADEITFISPERLHQESAPYSKILWHLDYALTPNHEPSMSPAK